MTNPTAAVSSIRRYSAGDSALQTTIGHKTADLIRLNGGPGYGLYGPYVALGAGQCIARIFIEGPAQGHATVDIAAQHGQLQFDRRRVDLSSIEGSVVELRTILSRPMAGCEVRLYCEDEVHANICAVEIEFQDQYQLFESWEDGDRAWFISELENGARFWVRSDDRFVSRSVARGGYKPAETAFVRRHVRRGMNVVDVGANIGWFTVNMAMLVGPGGRVDAFEPRKVVAHYLRRTVTENKLSNVVVHRCALADANGKGLIAFDEKHLNPGDAHLVFDETPPGETTEEITLRRLDSIVWTGVDFIKVDVEGAEKLVFDGAEVVLTRDRPLILSGISETQLRRASQISVADYLAYFSDLDYEVHKLSPSGRCGEYVTYEDIAADNDPLSVACVPAEKASDILSR